MENILELSEVNKSLGNFQIKNISFSLPRGYIMGFIGPNGAGKTTTIKLIMDLVNRDSGEILVFGQNNRRSLKEIKQKVGFVYDENYFYDFLTIEQMARIVAPFYRNWDESVFQRYLKDFDLPARKKIKDLSRGMKMKFSLALALSHRAELIIMDEPTSGLDPVFRSELLEILQGEMQDDNRGILLSSHITSDLERIADYICLINNGEVVCADIIDNIMEKYLVVKGPRHLLNELSERHLMGIKANDFGFEALCDKPDQIKHLFQDEAVYEKPSLDQIILYTARRDKSAAIG
jgi:ABC-type multidrug transport system, ATPase component